MLDRRAFFALAMAGAGATALPRLRSRPAEPAYNVRSFGARGDGWSDDSAAFQTALDTAAADGGGVVMVPHSAGEYMLAGVELRSHVRLQIAPGTVLRALAGLPPHRPMLRVEDVREVQIHGGIIDGSRDRQEDGEHRHGISIRGARDVLVRDVTVRRCAGDGIYIGSSAQQTFSSAVEVSSCWLDHNRRQGISLVSGRSVVIEQTRITGTAGTAPQAGLDLEPNEPREFLQGVRIRDLFTARNAGGGILIAPAGLASGSAPVDVEITGHVSVEDAMGFRTASMPSALGGHVLIEGARWIRSGTHGFLARNWSADGPAIRVDRAVVIDANQRGLQSERFGSAIAVYKSADDPELPTVIGNVMLRAPEVRESRGESGASWAFYLRNDVEPARVARIRLIAPHISGMPAHRYIRRSPGVVLTSADR